MLLHQCISGYSLVLFLYTVLYGKGVRELAGKFNSKDQIDFKFNVNGKEVSNEEGAAQAQEFINKMSDEMSGLIRKLGSKVTDTVSKNSVDAIKDKIIPSSINALKDKVVPSSLNAIKDKVLPSSFNMNSIKDLLKQENLDKMKEKLPVIEASNEDGNVKVNVNGKSLFSLDLSNFKK